MIRNASELRHRISLQKPTKQQYDEEGYPASLDGAWEEAIKVWALVRDVSGKEFFSAHAVQALNVVTVEMRARKDIAPDDSWSIVYKGNRYLITHINHRDYKGQWWEVKTERVALEEGGGGGGV